MKINVASLIGLALDAIEAKNRAVTVIREIIKRDSPEDLADFDARVESAHARLHEAKAAATAEEGGK